MDVRVYCLLVLSLLSVLLHSSSAHDAREQLELPSATVVGRVYCDTRFHHEFSKSSHFISGASVAVECGDAADKSRYRKVARTERRGVFRVRLPASVSKHANLIEASGSAKRPESNEPLRGVEFPSVTAGVRLMSKRNGAHVYSAGTFTIKPMDQPKLCGRRRPASGARKLAQLPTSFLAPPSIPLVPSPPSIGPVPVPANPLFPPPPLLPPNPLQPPPPPSVLPPNPLQPPSPPAFNFPTVPFLAPPPPPPPALPFPPVPVTPIPRVPGVPPAKEASP